MSASKARLYTSPDLKKAMRALLTSLNDDTFRMSLTNTQHLPEHFDEKIAALHRALYSNIEGRGTADTLRVMWDACTPTDWLVTFLTSRQTTREHTLREYIQTVLAKLHTMYMMMGIDTHHRWERTQNACMSSLLMQLKSAAH